MSWHVRSRAAALAVGLVLVLAGGGILGYGLYQRLSTQQTVAARGQQNVDAVNQWLQGAPSASPPTSAPAASSTSPPAAGSGCGGGSDSQAYALVEFTGLPQYGYAAVSVNGNWSLLDNRDMVHWYASPAPGGTGNVIIAFHREPNFEYIDQLSAGDTITIQDRSCNSYVYTVTNFWTLSPSQVTQLVPTSGHLLTMITCTPWWQDYDRLVWRADLTSVDGTPVPSS